MRARGSFLLVAGSILAGVLFPEVVATALTNASGTVVERYGYAPFGAPTATSSVGNPFYFTGREWDADLQAYWYRSRYYDPTAGRFLARDTTGMWGDTANLGNPYSYCANNPWSYTDPYGLAPEWLEATGRVALTGGIVGLNVAAWVFTGPFGGVPVTGFTLGAGGATSYYNRQAQYMEATGESLPVAESAVVVVGDLTGASQTYGAVVGRDPLTDAPLSTANRIEGAATVVVGIGAGVGTAKVAPALKPALQRGPVLWGKTGAATGETAGAGPVTPVPNASTSQAAKRFGTLSKIGDNAWESAGGLRYVGTDRTGSNRVQHVLRHAKPEPSRPVHSVFNVPRSQVLGLVDEAWGLRGAALPNDPGAFVVPMGRTVGTAGENAVKIIVRPGTSEIVTAYPVSVP